MLSQVRKEMAIQMVQRLVQCKSYSGREEKIARLLKQTMLEFGFDDVHTDKHGNLVGVILGNKPGKKLLFDAHMDTASVLDIDQWSDFPWLGTIKDNKIYGCGAADMKGSIAAVICASAFFAQDRYRNFAGEIYVGLCTHGIGAEGITAKAICDFVQPDFVIITEPSQLKIMTSQLGRSEITIELTQKNKENDKSNTNLIQMMFEIIKLVNTINNYSHSGSYMNKLILKEIIPLNDSQKNKCIAKFDRDFSIKETSKSILKTIQYMLVDFIAPNTPYEVKTYISKFYKECYTGTVLQGEHFFGAWKTDLYSDFFKQIKKSVVSSGIRAELDEYNYCTNGSYYASIAKIPTIGFGPTINFQVNHIDENISCEDLWDAITVYFNILKNILH